MAKTLQEQYKLLKEGKSDATDVFLKSAKSLFPQFITNYATFDEASTILKQKGVISENFVGLTPTNAWEARTETDYEKAYKKFLKEAEETKIKADSKKVAKSVEDSLESNWNADDTKNADNLNFNEILKGYKAELGDPKNADKTTAELLTIVLKNLSKDELFYVKNGEFGVKGLGYTDQAPGLKASKTDQMTKVENENSIANITKANTKDVTDKLPKSKIKDEMTYATKSQKGVAKMAPQGTKEKKVKLSEILSTEDPAYIEPRITEEDKKKTEDLRSQGYKYVGSHNRGGEKYKVWKKDRDFYLQDEKGNVEKYGSHMPMFEEQMNMFGKKDYLVELILDLYNIDQNYQQIVDNYLSKFQYTSKYDTNDLGEMLYDLELSELEELVNKMPNHMNENKKNLLENLYLGMGNSAKRNNLVEYYNNFIREEEEQPAAEKTDEAKKKMPLADRLKEIEKQSALTALEEKINALDEEIATRNERLQVAEGEDISEFVSSSKLKELKKEIKELEKIKEKYNKELTKKGGKKKEMIDETEDLQEAGTGDAPINMMSREELVDYLDMSAEESAKYSDEVLKDMAADKTSDMMENDTQSLNESVDPFKAFKRFLRK